MNIEVLLAIVSGGLLVWVLILQISLKGILRRQKKMLQGSQGKSLEKVLLETQARTKDNHQKITELGLISKDLFQLSSQGIHRVGLIRFNPFQDIGGDQSFSLALLDGQNNGFTLSSLYSREGVRIYCKAIQGGKSPQHQLSKEEEQAISQAVQSAPTPPSQGKK